MFTTILYGFGMIWLELTRTDVVFSRTTVVSFFVLKIYGDFFGPKENPEAQELDQKSPEAMTR